MTCNMWESVIYSMLQWLRVCVMTACTGMVLTDDILGHGKMDLLVTTMSGNVFCFSTESLYHPLKAWYVYSVGVAGVD